LNIKEHVIHYLILVLILAAALALFFIFRFHPVHQFIIVAGASLSYMVWGIMHHALEDRVTVEVMAEYFLIGGVVIVGAWLTLL